MVQFAKGRYRVIVGDSVEAAGQIQNGLLDFAFIDGDHTHEGVSRDLDAWWPKVRDGGLLCGHDWRHPRDRRGLWGVESAVRDFAALRGLVVEYEDDLWWIVKPGQPTREETRDVMACV